MLNDIVYLIIQSKAIDTDIYQAIISSGLKETYPPCILLKKGVSNYNLQKIIDFPEMELGKGFKLLLNLFKIAYKRRFLEEKENPNKWWHWDLSNTNNIEILMNKNQ